VRLQEREAEIEHLDISNNGITEGSAQDIAALLQGKKVKKLNVNMNALGDAGMYKLADALSEVDTLEELDLGGNNIGPEGATVLMNSLKGKKSLHTLELGYVPCESSAYRGCETHSYITSLHTRRRFSSSHATRGM
jgi:NLR family CARD domain-containing protein 3